MKKLLLFITIILLCGCASSGTLSDKEKDNIMKYLTKENYIDESCELKGLPRGEGELARYICNTKVDDEEIELKVIQHSHNDEYRVFTVINNSEELVLLKIDNETKKVTKYEE